MEKNLESVEAVEKLRELVMASPICMFGTRLSEIPAHFVPMQTQEVDDAGSLWFFSGLDSEHSAHIEADPRVHLIYENPSAYEFLTVFGEATISKDQEKIEKLWTPFVKAWFPDGKEDANLSLIQVRPRAVRYWDTKDGKLVSMAKIMMSAVTGKMKDDGGVEGELRV